MKPDWNAIRAEYIGGGISQRKLAKKYGVTEGLLLRRANSEGWTKLRETAYNKTVTLSQQKIATAAANSAAIAERIRQKLLKRLEEEIDRLPESIGTEMEQNISNYTYEGDGDKKGGGSRVKSRTDGGKRYKLKDLTGAYMDLVKDMPKENGGEDDPLMAVLKRWNDASGITG